jgi:8-oxo-dGTP pyrophosphatase MutT (NUDIX family)
VAQGVEEGVEEEPAKVARLSDVVRAAGGVVWRRNEGGDVEVLLVHRPKYDDWTLPKGKLDPDEAYEDAALREIEEETGVRGVLGPELPSTDYEDADGRPKHVRYWAMEAADGRFTPNKEVDDVRWVRPDEARRLLSYDRDKGVLDAFGHLDARS